MYGNDIGLGVIFNYPNTYTAACIYDEFRLSNIQRNVTQVTTPTQVGVSVLDQDLDTELA